MACLQMPLYIVPNKLGRAMWAKDKNMDEITYSPGMLAKKYGISRRTLMRHLKETGLIKQCVRKPNGRWRIPYSIAAGIGDAGALAIITTRQPRRNKPEITKEIVVNPPRIPPRTPADILLQKKDYDNLARYYKEIGTVLQNAGVTMGDMLKGADLSDIDLSKYKGGFNYERKTQNNSAARRYGESDEPEDDGRSS